MDPAVVFLWGGGGSTSQLADTSGMKCMGHDPSPPPKWPSLDLKVSVISCNLGSEWTSSLVVVGLVVPMGLTDPDRSCQTWGSFLGRTEMNDEITSEISYFYCGAKG